VSAQKYCILVKNRGEGDVWNPRCRRDAGMIKSKSNGLGVKEPESYWDWASTPKTLHEVGALSQLYGNGGNGQRCKHFQLLGLLERREGLVARGGGE